MRASPRFDNWLNEVRNPNIDHPIDELWLHEAKAGSGNVNCRGKKFHFFG